MKLNAISALRAAFLFLVTQSTHITLEREADRGNCLPCIYAESGMRTYEIRELTAACKRIYYMHTQREQPGGAGLGHLNVKTRLGSVSLFLSVHTTRFVLSLKPESFYYT